MLFSYINYINLLLIFIFNFTVLTQPLVQQEWVAKYSGPDSSSHDYISSMVIDDSGCVYVTGISEYKFQTDIITIKYNSSGIQQWIKKYGSLMSNDKSSSIALDNYGNIYVSGQSYEKGGSSFILVLIKYSPEGFEQWEQKDSTINDTGGIILDDSNNIYLSGVFDGDYFTIKYNCLGEIIWIQRYNSIDNTSDTPYSIALDRSGNIFVTGYALEEPALDWLTLKYNSQGILQWDRYYNGPGNNKDAAFSIVVDESGCAIAGGFSTGINTKKDFTTIKYNPDGTEQWVQKHSTADDDELRALTLDNNGNIYVTGYSGSDYATIKYNSSGIQQWFAAYNGAGNRFDHADAIAVDNSGNVYITGTIYEGSDNTDIATIKYDSNGVQQWIQSYKGFNYVFDTSKSIKIDGSGNVYISGYGYNTMGDFDFIVIKYSQK